MYGYLSEASSFGETEEVPGEYAEELAAECSRPLLNVEFDPDLSFDEKKRSTHLQQNRPHYERHAIPPSVTSAASGPPSSPGHPYRRRR